MATHVQPYRIGTASFLRAYVVTMRPYLLFVSGITGIAGMSLAGEITTLRAAIVFLAAFFSYGFGQAITDCFQIDTDRRSSPYRPLTQGLLSKSSVAFISLTGLTLCTAALSILNPVNLLFGGIAGAGLALYTPFKRRWWGGPFYNAWIVCVLFLMAFFAATGEHTIAFSPRLGYALTAVLFGYANFVLSGYFKDIEADRATGYNTFPVIFGRKFAALVSDCFALCCVIATACAILFYLPIETNFIALIVLILGMVVSVASQIKLHTVRTDDEAHGAIGLDLAAYGLLLSTLVLSAQPNWLPELMLFATAYALTLKFRPSKAQI